MKTRIMVVAMALGAGTTLAGQAAAGGGASYDGTWNVRLVTEAGSCDAAYNATVAIRGGRIAPVDTRSDGDVVTGGVGGDGRVALGIQRSIARADAYGRLSGRSGSGVWKVAMLGCSGRWTAQRRTVEARAE